MNIFIQTKKQKAIFFIDQAPYHVKRVSYPNTTAKTKEFVDYCLKHKIKSFKIKQFYKTKLMK